MYVEVCKVYSAKKSVMLRMYPTHRIFISNAVKKFIFDNKLQKTILNKTVTFQDYTIIKLFT